MLRLWSALTSQNSNRYPLRRRDHPRPTPGFCSPNRTCLRRRFRWVACWRFLVWCWRASRVAGGRTPGWWRRTQASLGLLCTAGQEWCPWRCSSLRCQSYEAQPRCSFSTQLASPWGCTRSPGSSCNCDWIAAWRTGGWFVSCPRTAHLPLQLGISK